MQAAYTKKGYSAATELVLVSWKCVSSIPERFLYSDWQVGAAGLQTFLKPFLG